ncbi:MAG: hypothetical protein V1753_08405, partial [Pseudomonadota bacterium]
SAFSYSSTGLLETTTSVNGGIPQTTISSLAQISQPGFKISFNPLVSIPASSNQNVFIDQSVFLNGNLVAGGTYGNPTLGNSFPGFTFNEKGNFPAYCFPVNISVPNIPSVPTYSLSNVSTSEGSAYTYGGTSSASGSTSSSLSSSYDSKTGKSTVIINGERLTFDGRVSVSSTGGAIRVVDNFGNTVYEKGDQKVLSEAQKQAGQLQTTLQTTFAQSMNALWGNTSKKLTLW